MFAEPEVLATSGLRVRVSTVHKRDIAAYRDAVAQSRERLARWNPVDPDDLDRHLPLQSRDYRTFLIHALSPEGVAATVQPGNLRSAGLLRSMGFQREGFSPRMLWLPDPTGSNAWRDHHSYVMLGDQWPAPPYSTVPARRVVALVNGATGSATMPFALQLAVELGVPLFRRDALTQSGSGALWAILADSPVGGVVTGCFGPGDAGSVAEGLRRCGLDPAAVPEVWCRSVSRHGSAAPLALGQVLVAELDNGAELLVRAGRADIVRIALQVSDSPAPAFET